MKTNKDPNVKDRKYNGSPYLKLKKVKSPPRKKIRQRLRETLSLAAAELENK